MATWSARRKYTYFALFFTGILIIFGVPAFFLLYEKPTCSDGIQNGSERGIDCSGSCTKLCPADFSLPRVIWTYSMRVVPGVYNAIAYAQNSNQTAEVRSVPYTFKVYDDKGGLVTERKGSTFVPAGQKFAVFEGGIQSERPIVRTTFEFGEISAWRQGNVLSKIKTVNTLLDQGEKPSAEVTIKNIALDEDFSNIDAFIVLYDAQDNRVAFSKTTVDKILANQSAKLYFTWPESFSKQVVRTEVIFVVRPKK